MSRLSLKKLQHEAFTNRRTVETASFASRLRKKSTLAPHQAESDQPQTGDCTPVESTQIKKMLTHNPSEDRKVRSG
jgi:hypothetical protein